VPIVHHAGEKMEQPELASLVEGMESIPTLPSVATRLLEIVVDDTSSVRDVAKIVEADAALSAKVLRVINSPAYGLRHKVSTISHAIALLGFASLKSLVLSVSVFDSLLEGKKEGRMDKVVFWQHCLATAAAARQIAKDNGYDMPEEASWCLT
jgi:two-component system cell cycle response regulator